MTNAIAQNTDEKMRAAILYCLAKDERVYANLRVGVINGIVHLAGVVASIETRILAAELVGEITGVRGVVNRIEAPGAPSPARTINLNLQNKKENKYE